MAKSIFLFLLVSSLVFTTMSGQKLTVMSFGTDDSDITASTQRRHASDGRACALIKIQTADRILKLEGEMNVGEMSRKGTTTLVYLPSDTYGISLTTEHYGTVDVNFSDYGIESLKSLSTYVLVLAEKIAEDPDNPTDAKAQYELGLDYKMPRRNKQKDVDKALHWFTMAAEQGLAEAQLEVGRHYVATRQVADSTLVIRWLGQAAKQGIADAQYELSEYLLLLWWNNHGDDDFHPFIRMRHFWQNKAAENGNVKAMESIGKYYVERIFYSTEEIEEMLKWNTIASNKGSAEAAFNQGQIYEYHYKDFKTAKTWYQKACNRGHKKACVKINQVYFKDN